MDVDKFLTDVGQFYELQRLCFDIFEEEYHPYISFSIWVYKENYNFRLFFVKENLVLQKMFYFPLPGRYLTDEAYKTKREILKILQQSEKFKF